MENEVDKVDYLKTLEQNIVALQRCIFKEREKEEAKVYWVMDAIETVFRLELKAEVLRSEMEMEKI